ncbi:hypothetical protein [Inquilinus sp. CAU 1745]|uniref:hypothetical protein n=1 Tax=Inquilinus sp. CAU 1745 TaxID=3140369 RepID=UPI00325A895A
MSLHPYVGDRVTEALEKSKGDPAAAQRLLLALCDRDEHFLKLIAGPFLKGIVAHAIQAGGRQEKPASRPRRELSGQAFDDIVGAMGRRIGVGAQPSGMTALVRPPQPVAAGQGHQETIRHLAAAYSSGRRKG